MDASEDSFGEEGAIRFYDVEDLPAQTHRQSFSENILREESRDSLNSNDDLASQAAKSTEFASKSTEFASKSTESPANSNVDSKEPGDDFDPRFLIRNLDTDEKFHVAELDTKFPGLLTLDTFVEAKKSWSPDVKAAQEDAAEQEMDLEQDEEHLRKKESAGWFKKLFGRRSSISKDPTENNRVQIKLHKKVQSDFNPLKVIQQMSLNSGPIWALKLSPDGNYLAAAGSDAVVRIWTVAGSPAHIEFIEQLARKDQEAASNSSEQSMPPLSSRFARKVSLSERAQNEASTEIPHESNDQKEIPEKLGGRQVIFPEVFREFRGHSSDIVDLSWSPANFLLSASLDKTVRLWHVSKDKCLCKFQHADFVTSVMFHPTSMKLFLSGSYDRILRVWNILDHRVESWAQVDAVITSASYSPDGKLAVAGLASGQCVFYRSDGLNYFTQIDCKNRHGKHSVGRKVTGLQFFRDCKHLLVTTCDSRIRLYDMDDKAMRMKFKGLENEKLPIRASFSEDGKYVICGSEDHEVYIWNASKDGSSVNEKSFVGGKTDRNASFEHFKAHENAATVSIFMPKQAIEFSHIASSNPRKIKQMLISASFDGVIRVFEQRS